MTCPKRLTRIDAIGKLDFIPEKAAGEYAVSKRQKEFYGKPPNWNSVGDSREFLLTRNQNEHNEMLELQNEMLPRAKMMAALNESRTQQLYNIQANLRSRFVDINSFMKDCSERQRSAEKVLTDEKLKQEKLAQNIWQCRQTLDGLNEFRETLVKTVDEMEPYEAVIVDVVNKSPIFDSIKDCMDRCDALMIAQLDIKSMDEEKIQEMEKMRLRMIKVTNEAALSVLGMKNEIAELERAYADQRNACCKWERIYEDAREAVTSNQLQKDRIQDSINNLYKVFSKRRATTSSVIRSSMEEKLEFIREEFLILQEVVKECKADK